MSTLYLTVYSLAKLITIIIIMIIIIIIMEFI